MISLETAQQIATRALQERMARSPIFSHYPHAEVRLEEENDHFRVFAAFSEAAFQAGVMPPVLHLCVDKADGHLLTEAEQERYYDSGTSATRRLAQETV